MISPTWVDWIPAMTNTFEDESFWQPTEPIGDAPELPTDTLSALERLGPSPFPKSGFPFLGFLATVYDQIATHVAGAQSESTPGAVA